jgi:hypothetical protein
VKVQAPLLLAVVAPTLSRVVLHTVTMDPPAAVPVSVIESLGFAAMLLMTGAATLGFADTVSATELEGALVPPAEVESVAVNP